MRAGRELDRTIAQKVMGRVVTEQKREVFEATEKGMRPLANYTTDINAAWEVAERMAITLIPVQPKHWFALVGKRDRWESPADFLKFLSNANFIHAGAAVGDDAAMVICTAALKAVVNKEARESTVAEGDRLGSPDANRPGPNELTH